MLGTPVSGKCCYFSLDKLDKSCVARHDIGGLYKKNGHLLNSLQYNSRPTYSKQC